MPAPLLTPTHNSPPATPIATFASHPAGKDFVHQLNMVCKVVGTPTPQEIAAVPSEKARSYLASMPYFPKGGECHWGVGWGGVGVPSEKVRSYLAPMPYFPKGDEFAGRRGIGRVWAGGKRV